MLKDIMRDLTVFIKYNSLKGNLCLVIIFACFIASAVLSGNYYPFIFFVFSLLFWIIVMSAAGPGSDHICDYMTPLSDEERKKQYILKMIVHSVIFGLIMFLVNIMAMIFGGHRKIHDYFICIVLFHIILVFTVLNFSFELNMAKSITGRFIYAGNYLSVIVSAALGISLLREDGSTGIVYQNWDMTGDFGHMGIAATELAVIAVQLIIFKYHTSKLIRYEYSENKDFQGINMKGGRK